MITPYEFPFVKVGSRVTYVYDTSGVPPDLGTVLNSLPRGFIVQWDRFVDAQGVNAKNSNLFVVCRNCDQLKENHAVNLKCLFSPTSYEI